MKLFSKNMLFIFFVFVFCSCLNAQKLTKKEMLEFYPYNIGNTWSYRWVFHNIDYDYYEAGRDKIVISKDTVVNNIKYWIVKYYTNNYRSGKDYLERIDSISGDVFRIENLSEGSINRVDNVYTGVGDTISISNNRYLLYCDKMVILSIRDTMINNFHTTMREILGLPGSKKLFLARNIGILGSGKSYWIDSAKVNDTIFSNMTDVKVNNEPIKSEFVLHQNYPNPFNPKTSINYSIPKSCFVSIKIYDVTGREIASLVNEEKLSGNYKVSFNAANLSSGIYFYQMKVPKFTQTKKMLFVK